MKKILVKDKKLRKNFLMLEIDCFLLKSILRNRSIGISYRFHSVVGFLRNIPKISSISNRCIEGYSQKRFNRLTKFSRHLFLKHMRFEKIFGMRKSVW